MQTGQLNEDEEIGMTAVIEIGKAAEIDLQTETEEGEMIDAEDETQDLQEGTDPAVLDLQDSEIAGDTGLAETLTTPGTQLTVEETETETTIAGERIVETEAEMTGEGETLQMMGTREEETGEMRDLILTTLERREETDSKRGSEDLMTLESMAALLATTKKTLNSSRSLLMLKTRKRPLSKAITIATVRSTSPRRNILR